MIIKFDAETEVKILRKLAEDAYNPRSELTPKALEKFMEELSNMGNVDPDQVRKLSSTRFKGLYAEEKFRKELSSLNAYQYDQVRKLNRSIPFGRAI